MEKPREQILYTNIQVNLYFIIMVSFLLKISTIFKTKEQENHFLF